MHTILASELVHSIIRVKDPQVVDPYPSKLTPGLPLGTESPIMTLGMDFVLSVCEIR